MIYSHFFNLLVTMGVFIGGIGSYLYCGSKLEFVFSLLFYVLAIPVGLVMALFLTRVAWPIANILYLALMRGTIVSFRQARDFNILLAPIGKHLTWYQLKELKDIDKDKRIEYIYDLISYMVKNESIILPKNKFRLWFLGLEKLEVK